MLDFSLLEEELCFSSTKLDVFEKRGIKAPITDFAILLGGAYSSMDYAGEEILENRTGDYWLTSKEVDEKTKVISATGKINQVEKTERDIGCRPAIRYSLIKDYCSSIKRADDGVLEVEFGEYPQYAAPLEIQKKLNEKHALFNLKRTEKVYTVDKREYYQKEKNFFERFIMEYELDGKKYAYVEANTCYDDNIATFSNRQDCKNTDFIWVEVLPVKWLVDEKEDIAVSERILFSGVQFNNFNSSNVKFDNSELKQYLNKCFAKDILSSSLTNQIFIDSNGKVKIQNAYNFNFENVTEEDLIRGSLESNITPFLHGKSSDGKSARIKQFDPDAEIVYLRNATPDSLNGKSVYDSKNNRMIDVPPTWYVKLKEKCDAEPDKLHIVFFDELTNALPSIQGMAFNIILDKEINGKWKLPENARVAAAGNYLEDSLAANTMAEPLFNRFNHIYINTSVNDWLSWALTPNNTYERLEYKKEDTTKQFKIHPAIYAYIACKKDRVLRTPYTGVKPNADPRKWEMASKVLYQTNNPYMLRGLIGEDLTHAFAAFCKTKVISIEDVINGNYDDKIFGINSAEKYMTVLSLSNVDEQNLEVIRSFIEKLGKEYLALFDSLWTIGDDERLERLMNLKQNIAKVLIRR